MPIFDTTIVCVTPYAEWQLSRLRRINAVGHHRHPARERRRFSLQRPTLVSVRRLIKSNPPSIKVS